MSDRKPTYYIGLMSGTSLDSIDAVIACFEPSFELIATHTHPIPDSLKSDIARLMQPGDQEIDLMGEVDYKLGALFANACNEVITKSDLTTKDIVAIGSHGQTIRHRPELNFTLQIGSGSMIAEKTGITTVADFRSRDLAAGGQGAPLVPAFHHALFHSTKNDRGLLNIGGMANLTVLPSDLTSAVTGFDTGPGNILLDSWIRHCQGLHYDNKGEWAASGKTNQTLLDSMLSLPYFKEEPPKSTGRELFNLDWIKTHIGSSNISPEDIQRTLLALTAITVAQDIKRYAPTIKELFVCGGGSKNIHLLKELQSLLPNIHVGTTEDIFLDPDWVEAVAFAWLSKQCIEGKTGSYASVTGAKGNRILGAIYQA